MEYRGRKVSRQVVNYWVNQYRTGNFVYDANHDSAPLKPTILRRLSRSDVMTISATLTERPDTSSRDILRKLRLKGSRVSLSTTKRAIAYAGFTNTKPRYAQMVRHVNKVKRVEFCQRLLETDDNFDDVIFTDECTAQLHNNKVTFYRKRDAARPSLPKPKHPLKVHLWAGISRRGATVVLTFDGIMTGKFFTKKILKAEVVPFVRRVFPDQHRFQMDNDPKHRSKVAQDFMTENDINWWKEWPSGNFFSNTYFY